MQHVSLKYEKGVTLLTFWMLVTSILEGEREGKQTSRTVQNITRKMLKVAAEAYCSIHIPSPPSHV